MPYGMDQIIAGLQGLAPITAAAAGHQGVGTTFLWDLIVNAPHNTEGNGFAICDQFGNEYSLGGAGIGIDRRQVRSAAGRWCPENLR